MRAIFSSIANAWGFRVGRDSARAARGFTIVEALVSIVILGVVGVAVFGAYASGFQTTENQDDADVVDSLLRSRMERLLATKFAFIASGSENVNYSGTNYNVIWTVSNIDLDGDTVAEATAKLVALTLGDAQLSTIVVSNEGKVGKVH